MQKSGSPAMSFESLSPLILFTAISTISPGGATTLATASGVQFGLRRSVPLLVGIATGLASMAAAAALGLAGAIATFPSLQLAMKAVGSIYLLWLAWRIGNNGPPNLGKDLARPTRLIAGVGLLWSNPKAWAMTMSAAASFSALAEGPGRLAVLLGCAFGIGAAVSLSLWCAAGQLLAQMLRAAWQWRAVNILLGLLLAVSIVPIWFDQ